MPKAPKKPRSKAFGRKKQTGQRTAKTPDNSEYELQKACVAHLKAIQPPVTFTATVGGVHLANGVRGAAMLKSGGYLNGIPDLCIYRAAGSHHGLFIELKLPGNKPTAQQEKVHNLLRSENYAVEVVYTTNEFERAVERYLSGGLVASDTAVAVSDGAAWDRICPDRTFSTPVLE
jgi:hypothetical protein